LSSPTYRALETVRLAELGSPMTYPELGDGGKSMQMSAVADQGGWLRKIVSAPPKKGTNTVIITHMPNIVPGFDGVARCLHDGVASDVKDGEDLIFAANGSGDIPLVAKIKIEEWPLMTR